jgi:hypothetical protein
MWRDGREDIRHHIGVGNNQLGDFVADIVHRTSPLLCKMRVLLPKKEFDLL